MTHLIEKKIQYIILKKQKHKRKILFLLIYTYFVINIQNNLFIEYIN